MKTHARPVPAAFAATVRAFDDSHLDADAHATYATMNPLAALVAYGTEASAAVRAYHLTEADHNESDESDDAESADAEASDSVRISAAFAAAINAFATADRAAASF
jgi:hypothetical protein